MNEYDNTMRPLNLNRLAYFLQILFFIRQQNTAPQQRSIAIVLSASSILYTGTMVSKLKRSHANIVLKPNQSNLLLPTVITFVAVNERRRGHGQWSK